MNADFLMKNITKTKPISKGMYHSEKCGVLENIILIKI